MSIPKIIHQFWWQGEKLIPAKFNKYREEIKKMHPNWDYEFWDELRFLDLIKNDLKAVKKYYKFDYMIQKLDYMKAYVLYKFGGICVDMDSFTNQNLDKLFEKYQDYDFICSNIRFINMLSSYIICKSFGKCLNNGNLIAKKEADFTLYLLENMETECSDIIKPICVSNTTGPIKFNQVYYSYLNTDRLNKSKIKILDEEYLEPCVYNDCIITENTYVIHKQENSWVDGPILKLIKIYLKHQHFINIIIVVLIVLILYKFKKPGF